MNAHLARALVLLEQSRLDLAEPELRQSLLIDPNNSTAHAMLSHCLRDREDWEAATHEAEQAIVTDPEDPRGHDALACVLLDRNRIAEAQATAEEAVRLDPFNAGWLHTLGMIHLATKKWESALSVANRGLELDPDHVGCTNLQARALVQLGRRDEAGMTLDAALARNPEDSLTHANLGWSLLDKGDPRQAMTHFGESLRLDPNNEWARLGLVESMKARNLIYRYLLKYFLSVSKLETRIQMALVFGVLFGTQIVAALVSAVPLLAPFEGLILGLYQLLVVVTWLADSLFNLLLQLDRNGRLALSHSERVASSILGLWLLMSGCCMGWGWWLDNGVIPPNGIPCFGYFLFWTGFKLAFISLPLTATFNTPAGWPRWTMAGITAGLVVMATATLALSQAADMSSVTLKTCVWLSQNCVLATALSTWAATGLAVVRVRK